MPLDGSPLIRLEAILLPLFIVFAILATGGLIMVCFFVEIRMWDSARLEHIIPYSG